MNCKLNASPSLMAGMLMELLYLCSDHLAVLERSLGEPGAFLRGLWQGVTVALLLLGLLQGTARGQKLLSRLCRLKKGGEDKSC